MLDEVMSFFNSVDNVMYYPILIIVLAAAGLFFPSVRDLYRSVYSEQPAS